MVRPWGCFFAPLAHNWAWEDGERRKYFCAYLHVWHWWYNIKVIYVYNFFPILCTGVLLPSLPTVVHCFSDKLGTAWVPEMVAAVHFRIVLLYWCKFTPCSHFVCCCHHCRSLTDCCLYANHLILLEYCFSTYCGNAYTAIKFTHLLNFFERALTREKPWPGHLCVRLQFTDIMYQSRYLWVPMYMMPLRSRGSLISFVWACLSKGVAFVVVADVQSCKKLGPQMKWFARL